MNKITKLCCSVLIVLLMVASLGVSAAVKVKSIKASNSTTPNSVTWIMDKKMDTKWAVESKGSWIRIELDEIQSISSLAIAWYAGDERASYYNIELSTDGYNWNSVKNGESSGTTDELENYTFAPADAKYIKITVNGNSSVNASNWSSIWEVTINGETLPIDETRAKYAKEYNASFEIWPASRRVNNTLFMIGNQTNHLTFSLATDSSITKMGRYKFKLESPLDEPIILTIDIPAEIEYINTAGDNDELLPQETETFDRDGKTYNRYIITLDSKDLTAKLITKQTTYLMYSYMKPPADFNGKIFWELRQKNATEPLIEDSTNLAVAGTINPLAKLPANFICGFNGGKNLWSYPEKNYTALAEFYSYLGINDNEIIYSLTPFSDDKKNLCTAMRNQGIKLTALRSGSFGELPHPAGNDYKGTGLISLGLIGVIDRVKNNIQDPAEAAQLAAISPYIDNYVFDYEPWDMPTDDASKDSADYAYNQNLTTIAFVKTLDLDADETAYNAEGMLKDDYRPGYDTYRQELMLQPIRALRTVIDNNTTELSYNLTHGSGDFSTVKYTAYDDVVDSHSPMTYEHNILYFYEKILEMPPLNGAVIPISSYGWADATVIRHTPEEITMDIIACAATGAAGYKIWPSINTVDEGIIYGSYRGMQMIALAENFYNSGTASNDIAISRIDYMSEYNEPDSDNRLRSYVHQLDGKYLITLLNFLYNETCFVEISGSSLANKYLQNLYTGTIIPVGVNNNIIVKVNKMSPAMWVVTPTLDWTATPHIISAVAGAEGTTPGRLVTDAFDDNNDIDKAETDRTRWVNDGNLNSAWIILDLGTAQFISSLELLMYKSTARTYPLEIAVSNSSDFAEAWSGETTITSDYCSINLSTPGYGRFIRIKMTDYNSDANGWLSIADIKLHTDNSAPQVDIVSETTVQRKPVLIGDLLQLIGFVSDDALPNATVTTKWSKVNGPGTVFFTDSNTINTTVKFNTAGTYTLRLTADDSDLQTTKDITVIVGDFTTIPELCQIQSATAVYGDAFLAHDNNTSLSSRWSNGNVLDNAQITFDLGSSQKVSRVELLLYKGDERTYPLNIEVGDGTTFTSALNTNTTLESAGEYCSLNFTNAVNGRYVRIIMTGENSEKSNWLSIYEVRIYRGNLAPQVTVAVQPATIQLPDNSVELTGMAIDEGLPNKTLTTTWSKISGPGDVTFSAQNSVNSNAQFVVAGTYTLRLTANDGELTTSADVTVTVEAVPSYTLTYTAGDNGTISGLSTQTVTENGSGTEVTAVPDSGYQFTSWSDGVTSSSRTDSEITADLSVTANFTAVASGTTDNLLSVSSVVVGAEESINPASNAIDGDAATRWSSDGVLANSYIIFDLGNSEKVDKIALLFYKGDSRTYPLKVEVGDDLNNLSNVWEATTETCPEYYTIDITDTVGRYLKVSLTGANSSSNYYLGLYEAKIYSADKLELVSASASHSYTGSDSATTIDDDMATKWATELVDSALTIDLGTIKELDTVAIAWYKSDLRIAYFDLAVSLDNSSWTTLITNGESSGTNSDFEFHVLGAQFARYLKITCNGNSDSNWSSIWEVKAYTTEQTISSVSASDSYDGSDPATTIDGDMATKWATAVIGSTFDIDLGEVKEFSSVAIAWYKSNLRQAYFEIEVSSDNATWTTVVSNGVSSGTNADFESYSVGSQSARYIRITCNGNSSSNWTSIWELKIY